MITSSVLGRFRPSPIAGIFSTVERLRREGRDLLDFSIGEPDFDTPSHIREAGMSAIERGQTRYTPIDGSIDLKRAIRRKFLVENGLDYPIDHIVAGMGAKPLLASAVQAVLSPGDEAIVSTPCWPSHVGMIELAGGHAVKVVTSIDSGFKMTASQLDGAINPRTRLVILCSPSNPTGAVYSETELRELAEVLLRHPQVAILSDDLYEHILFDGTPFHTIAAIEPRLFNRTMTVNGLSKAYAMTGWRIGFAGGPLAWVNGVRQIYSQCSGGLCSISQATAIAALEGPKDFLADRASRYQSRRDLTLQALGAANGLRIMKPRGAFYLMPECSGLIGTRRSNGEMITSSGDFARYLLEDWSVVVVPGEGFECGPYFRISIATSEANLTLGMRLIAEASRVLADTTGQIQLRTSQTSSVG
ncbi:pyridoxal phosphate-dependent aminotransferase [Mesorhizobium waimense]|uniref:Aminotransferase n=1 Tax=Mesorhizobium waimense TaxID=1300307 RepID=A0A3A5K8Y1_9HYPH|nr:pyridoxal phosphate-dependent aminotransferase [Mesorhizobium waimense]RJT31982.1 pyridoxal phosphate-dependent aminotransferase [Mesorhizobium waimense]